MTQQKTREYSVIGKRLPDMEGPPRTTGAAQYTADIVLPRMLQGKILRSPYPHALIRNIDTSRAEKLAGVKAVITGKDTPGVTFGPIVRAHDEYPLAIGKVRYVGDSVAAVAAIDEDTAEEALELIKVEYEQLPAVYDPEEAMKDGAPQIHDKKTAPYMHDMAHNISRYVTWKHGDIDKAFAGAAHIREDRFVTVEQNHVPLEPHAAVVDVDSQGNVTCWSCTQIPYFLRYNLAKCMGIPESRVRVIVPHVGGAYGGKVDMFASQIGAAFLAQKTGRPVKIVYTREEVFIATRNTFPKIIYLKTGVNKDGTMAAQTMKVVYDNGAYNSTGPMIVMGFGGDSIYRVPVLGYEGILVYTNKTPSGPLRGHTSQQKNFATESHMDMIAADMGWDPVDFRLKNIVHSGYQRHGDDVVGSCTLKECIDSVVERCGWKEKRGKLGPNRGIGLALGSFSGAGGGNVPHNPLKAMCHLNADGRVTVYCGAMEQGQGAHHTLAMIAAEELGCPVDDVTFLPTDTAITPLDHGSFGSRVTFHAGNVVKLAAADTKRQLLEMLAGPMEAKTEDLDMRGGVLYVKGVAQKEMTFVNAVKTAQRTDKLPIIGTSEVWYRADLGFSQSLSRRTTHLSFYCEATEVEVDPDTGKIKGVSLTYANDCGNPLNPMRVEGQLEGALHMGVGMALGEGILRDNGQALNANLLDYKCATSLEMPETEPIHCPSRGDAGPYGAKEAGEGAVCPTAPAITSAIYDATGVFFPELPVTPDRVLQAIEKKQKSQKKSK